MHGVPDPVLGGRAYAGILKDLLEFHQRGMMLLGQLCDHRLAFPDILPPGIGFPAAIFRQVERFTESFWVLIIKFILFY